MFSSTINSVNTKPSSQFSQRTEKLISTSKDLFNDSVPELKSVINNLMQASSNLSKMLIKEEINRKDFLFDYSLLKKSKALQLLVDKERKEYTEANRVHEQKKIDLESQLEKIKGKILNAKLNNIVDDLHEMIKAEKLSLAIEDRIDEIADSLIDNKGSCSFFNCLTRNNIKEAEKKLEALQKTKEAFLSSDPSIVKKAVISEYEEQQQIIEKQYDQLSHNPPSKPPVKLSNELDEVTAKLEGGEERHNSSLSREASYQMLRIYALYKNILQTLSEPDLIAVAPVNPPNNDMKQPAAMPSAKQKLKTLFLTYEVDFEKSAEKFWCPDSDNKKLKHFYKSFINLSNADQTKFLVGNDIHPEFLAKLLPLSAVQPRLEPALKP